MQTLTRYVLHSIQSDEMGAFTNVCGSAQFRLRLFEANSFRMGEIRKFFFDEPME